jgi:glycosyltransferase involved in cell wall biosynthesis
MNNRFVIITPFYNVEEWIGLCVNSVKKQDYTNYVHYLIDDISTDNTVEKIQTIVKEEDKISLIQNSIKKYALKNIYDTLESIEIEDDDIVVILDGDDWLANKNVLKRLDEEYQQTNCLMTYGSYVEYPSLNRGKFAKKIPNEIIEQQSYRNHQWMSSHLRTFRYSLWNKINKKDFINKETGNFIKAAWDLAFVFPMLEMAGHRARFIQDILYMYNRSNPLNEDKINHPVQLSEEAQVRRRQPYEILKES